MRDGRKSANRIGRRAAMVAGALAVGLLATQSVAVLSSAAAAKDERPFIKQSFYDIDEPALAGYADPSWARWAWRPRFTLALNRDDKLCRRVFGVITHAVERGRPIYEDPIFVRWVLVESLSERFSDKWVTKGERVELPVFNDDQPYVLMRVTYNRVFVDRPVHNSITAFSYDYGHGRTFALPTPPLGKSLGAKNMYQDPNRLREVEEILYDNQRFKAHRLVDVMGALSPQRRELYQLGLTQDMRVDLLLIDGRYYFLNRVAFLETFYVLSIARAGKRFIEDYRCAFDAGPPPWADLETRRLNRIR